MTNSVYWEVVENEKSEFEAEVCIMNIGFWSCNFVIPFLIIGVFIYDF